MNAAEEAGMPLVRFLPRARCEAVDVEHPVEWLIAELLIADALGEERAT